MFSSYKESQKLHQIDQGNEKGWTWARRCDANLVEGMKGMELKAKLAMNELVCPEKNIVIGPYESPHPAQVNAGVVLAKMCERRKCAVCGLPPTPRSFEVKF